VPPRAYSRLPWVDHLRTFVIVLVVNMHACITYSHVGGWYYVSDHEPSPIAKILFSLWEALEQSFFMGLLFFLAGYFAHRSLARRGPGSFVRERLFRLGLPTLLFMLVIHPFVLLGLNPWHASFGPAPAFYAKYLYTGRFLSSSGPLWFAFALLIFCLVLALQRTMRPLRNAISDLPDSSPADDQSIGRFWLFGLALGIATFAVRLVQPFGTGVLNMQLCFFPQYIAFFAMGVLAGRRRWLLALAASNHARRAGWLALAVGPVALVALGLLGRRPGQPEIFSGGWHWQALSFAVWEQLTGLGLALGLLALFSRKLNRETTALRWLSDRAFGVYVLHTPVLVALAMVYRTLPQHPIPLAALLTVTGLAISYVLADIAHRTPGLRAIL
jgi:peptidoglycan/LPS O-acetylase OafA/YrhL